LETQRYFIGLSFDGTDFHGWQIQHNANSVQAELNKALALLLKRDFVETVGCGRTDTGVHAKKFYVHFESSEIENIPELIYHLNAILPSSIAINSIFPVARDAHARFSATSRTYQYRIYEQKDPFLKNRAYFFPFDVDINFMNALSNQLRDHIDFSSFSKSRTQTFTNNCTVTFADWRQKESELNFTITANRFLRNMVRAIVGTLLNAGLHKINEAEFFNILNSKNRSEAGMSVPAHGLYLTNITYPFAVL
jgi:tRNA pseudouridine38-40 synthase